MNRRKFIQNTVGACSTIWFGQNLFRIGNVMAAQEQTTQLHSSQNGLELQSLPAKMVVLRKEGGLKIIQYDWQWQGLLVNRTQTRYIVVHHTDGSQKQPIHQIWNEGIRAGDIGIAYHRIITGDGFTVQGRPDNSWGAQALGVNDCSIGIALEGDFQYGTEVPTEAQLAALKANLRDCMAQYPGAKIIGHRDVAGLVDVPSDATLCPGDRLYAMLPDIIEAVGGQGL
jgi:hypothetical protein